MYNKVELCGVDTAQLPVLSEAEKRQLLTRARAGDAAARQAMIEGKLRLVLSVVQRFAQRGDPALPAGQHRPAGQPQPARYRLQVHAGP